MDAAGVEIGLIRAQDFGVSTVSYEAAARSASSVSTTGP